MPTTMERFRPIAKIGSGGMASVELAVLNGAAGLNKLVVIKRLLPELAKDPGYVAMFVNEARVAARLSHPHVVSTFEVGADGDVPFIVMEYLEGQALSVVFRRLGRPHVPLPFHLHVLRGVLAGLEYTHNLTDFDGQPLGVVHRDVSPQNAFVCYDGRIKLLDFGIAKVNGLGGDAKPGALKGKIAYMAPEQLVGGAVDRRADVYSAGILLWEALAGRRMTVGEVDAQVITRRKRGEIPDLASFNPAAPVALVAVASRALAFDPAARFASAKDLLVALDQAMTAAGVTINEAEMGGFVADAFVHERGQIRGIVETQLKNLTFSSVGSSTLPELARVGSASEDTSASVAGTSGQISSTQASSLNGELAEPASERTFSVPAQRRRRVLLASLALTSAGALGGWFLLSPADAGKPAAAAASVVGVGAPDLLHIVVRSSPREAVLFLDGKRLPRNPATLEVPHDGSHHRLRAEAGASVLERALTYDREQSLNLDLAPHAPVARTPAVVGKTTQTSAGAPSAVPLNDPSSAPRAQDEARPTARPARAHRALDEQNPY